MTFFRRIFGNFISISTYLLPPWSAFYHSKKTQCKSVTFFSIPSIVIIPSTSPLGAGLFAVRFYFRLCICFPRIVPSSHIIIIMAAIIIIGILGSFLTSYKISFTAIFPLRTPRT